VDDGGEITLGGGSRRFGSAWALDWMKMKVSGAGARPAGGCTLRKRTSGRRLVDNDWDDGLTVPFFRGGPTYRLRRIADPPFDMTLPIRLAAIRVCRKNMYRSLLRGDCDPTTISGPIEILDDSRRPPTMKIIHMPRGVLL